jgi:hypothetical protein
MTFLEPNFRAVSGWNNAPSLTKVDPQPASPGVIDPDIRVGGEASRYGHGSRFTEWRYGFMTVAQFTAMNARLGISRTIKSGPVTIRTVLQDNYAIYANFNAVAVMPEPDTGYRYVAGRYLDVIYVFTRLEAI